MTQGHRENWGELMCTSFGEECTVVYDPNEMSTQIEREFIVEEVVEGMIATIENLSMDETRLDMSCFEVEMETDSDNICVD